MNEANLQVPCPTCKAKTGAPCRTFHTAREWGNRKNLYRGKGRPVKYVHVARIYSYHRLVDETTERFLDAIFRIADGRADDDLLFFDHILREVAEELSIPADWPELEPVKVSEFKARYRRAKASLAGVTS